MTCLRFLRGLLMLTTALLALGAFADVPVPSLTARVTDLTGTLTRAQLASLEQKLQQFEAEKGSQVAVLMVPTSEPETIEQYSIRVVEQWKLGRKGTDDGALLIIAKDDHTVRIEVGYGIEGVLTDAISSRIIREDIIPRFKEGNFFEGVDAGIDRIMSVIRGEALPPPKHARNEGTEAIRQLLPAILVLTVVLGGALRAFLGRGAGAVVTGGVVGVIGWLLSGAIFVGLMAGAVALFFTLVGGTPMGWRSGSGWGGLGGGAGRGGFSGGGGGFGGGGASGKW
ncbi:TPM domain-containing protein [Ralstonia chuxiongensis]|uniref:YgcG family protein n=1 Tax=Ralstonia chuxiongensis TaxID=2957504 RepID=A0AA42BJH4_9RALS|nr:YgcG family protein [Ralstonia chuxiongensis]MCP1175139.1 YgcG family protein [Ralstonia chuxiongensis]